MKSKKTLVLLLLLISTSIFSQSSKTGDLKFYKVNGTERISFSMQLKWLKDNLLKLSGDYDFKLIKTTNDNLGYTHYKYQEYFKGVKINNAVYSIHTKNGFVESANGEYYKNIESDLRSITPKNTFQAGYSKLKTQFLAKDVESVNTDKLPCIQILGNRAYLIYKIELRSFDPLKHVEFLVDATNLSILQELNKIHTIDVPGTATTFYNGTKSITCDNTGGVYKLTESTRNIATKNCNNGSSFTSATDFTNTSSSFVGTSILTKSHFDLHYGLEKSFDYYSVKFGRTSYDNAGAQIKGLDHYGFSYNNAFWSNPYMVFGDGDGSSYRSFATTDIVGHEFTHAVTESEAGLIYMNESGGLNESFSDIFGVCVDYYANPMTANFLEGEQCSLSGTPFRNMTNPKATLQPNTYLGQYWVPLNGPDNGGVHTNSQCQNFWFYLLTNGGSGVNDNSNPYNVTGIGISDAEKIAYRNLTVYLTPNSTFMDARNYAIQSAIDLFGACSNQVIQCTNAWYAVGLGTPYSNAVIAQFNSSSNYACSLPATFTFSNQSTNATTYAWDFGDGTTSTSTHPSKTYTAAGTYNIKLKSTGTASCNTVDSVIKNNYITVSNIGAPVSNCIPSQNTLNSSYGISNVIFGGINNPSSNATEGYKDFTCTNQTTLTAGNPYLLKVNTIYNFAKVYVWIDYNNDGLYNQTNELILASSPTLATNVHSLVAFTPTSAVLNTPLRLRVYDDIVAVGGACNIHTQGQTEDYTVIFKSATTKPLTNFFTTTKAVAVGSTVLFQDSSLNAPTSWKWTFQGASLATSSSTLQNPSVNYPTIGTYSVKLVTTNGFGSDSTTKISYISVTNSFNMCQASTSTTLAAGTLYDSGGVTGNYSNNEYCSFLINPGCAGNGTVTLTFTQFQGDNWNDYLTVYSGSTTASPILGYFYNLPPVLTSTNGALLLVWYSDSFNNNAGYTATWTSTVAGTNPPVANFTISNNNPPLNTPVTFSDQTTNVPIAWNWQFSDGTSSTLKNPVKTFTNSGVQTITLTATNCNTLSTVIKTITVQAAPTISFSPNPITASVSCSGSVTLTGTISNGGTGTLQYNTQNTNSNTLGKNVLFITSYMGSSTNEFNNMNSILSAIPNCTVTQHTLGTAATLSAALVGKNVLVIPEFETIPLGVIGTFSNVIQNFVSNGGVAVQCGNSQQTTNDIGLFSSTFMTNNWNVQMLVQDTTDMVTKTINQSTINAVNATFLGTFSNPGIIQLVKLGSNISVLRRDIGSGRAIFLGYDYFQTDVNASKILVNAVTRTGVGPSWLGISPSSGTVAASSTQTLAINFNSNGLTAGVYTNNLVINSNAPSTPSLTIPVSYSVIGTANASVSATCLNFGTVMQYTIKKDSITYYNTGCATLTVSTISATNTAYSYTPATSFTIAPWSSRKIYVTFSPQTAGNFADTLYINSNGGNKKVCLNGTSTSAPTITTSPSSLTFNLAACNASQTNSISILNTGGSNLNYTVLGASAATSSVNVLVITNLTNIFSAEYFNTINAITSNFPGATIIPHNLTTISSLTTALQNCKVLLFPEQFNYYYGVMQPFSSTFSTFVNNGGTAIICAAYTQTQLNEIGLLSANSSFFYNQSVSVIDTNDVIMKGLPMGSITSPNSNVALTITSPNTVDYVKAGGFYSSVSKRTMGLGRVVYIGTDFFNTNVNFGKIIANTVRSASSGFPGWLSSSSTNTGVVSPSGSSVFNLTANSAYLSAGTYTYNLVINSNDPLNTTYTVPVTINVGTNPCSNFNFTNANNCSGLVTFTQTAINPVSTYSWNFGNSTSSSLQNPSCTYTSGGTYSVSLTVCNGTLCSTATKTLTINNVGGPLSASCAPISYSYSSNYGILNVSLNTINKSSNYAYIEGYQDFSCLNQTNLTIGTNYTLNVSTSPFYFENVSVWIDYNNDGSFSTSEQVLNSVNKLQTHTVVITPPATAVLNTPLRMRIIDESSSGYIINTACYTSYYGQCEDYTVKILSPTAPPIANFSQVVNSCQGTVNFTDNTSGNPTSWIWNFGDGGASSQQNPTYTYANPGTYTVTLIAFNPFGNSSQTSVVTVNPLSFGINISGTQAIGQPLAFSSTYTNAIIYNWNFGNGGLSGLQYPVYTYTNSGVYTVSLTILVGSCIMTKTQTVNISSSVGVTALNKTNNDFSLAPNPASDELVLRSSLATNDPIYFKLFNSLGELVLMKVISGAIQEEKISINQLANGIYFAKIDCGNKQRTIKLVKE